MTGTDQTLLNEITDTKITDNAAYNIRKNGKVLKRKVTEDVSIESKADGSGIDIYVKENARHAFVYIPVLVTFSGLNDVVYNDFHIGKNASAIIVAGCAVKNNAGKTSRHQGIHRFYLEENASVSYLESITVKVMVTVAEF